CFVPRQAYLRRPHYASLFLGVSPRYIGGISAALFVRPHCSSGLCCTIVVCRTMAICSPRPLGWFRLHGRRTAEFVREATARNSAWWTARASLSSIGLFSCRSRRFHSGNAHRVECRCFRSSLDMDLRSLCGSWNPLDI